MTGGLKALAGSLVVRGGRGERWRGGLGVAYRSGPFVGRGFTSSTMPRSHLPLIEPDWPVSRVRLSDKDSCLRPREGACQRAESQQTQLLVQACVREAGRPLTLYLVLGTQPLAQPTTHVLIDRSMGLADRPQAEVVRPPPQQAVESGHLLCDGQQGRMPPGAVMDRVAQPTDLLGRRTGAQVGLARLLRVAPADGVPQKVERLFRQPAQAR